jgi:hypothetical protein
MPDFRPPVRPLPTVISTGGRMTQPAPNPVIIDPTIPAEMCAMDVSPELAAHWLTFNTHNRPLKDHNLEKISRDLIEGRWRYTAEPVKFSKTGVLLDGQHRLHAMVRTNIGGRVLVVPGLDDEVQDYMDTGTARGAADMLALHGERNGHILAAAIRIAIQMERGGLFHQKYAISNVGLRDWLEAHPEMREAVNFESHLKRILLSRSVVAYCAWRLGRIEHEEMEEFLTDLAEHRTSGAGDPRSALLSRLTTARQMNIRINQPGQISLIFRTWNAIRTGKPLNRIQVHYNGSNVDIPEPR